MVIDLSIIAFSKPSEVVWQPVEAEDDFVNNHISIELLK
jgi:hypothetical protein